MVEGIAAFWKIEHCFYHFGYMPKWHGSNMYNSGVNERCTITYTPELFTKQVLAKNALWEIPRKHCLDNACDVSVWLENIK